MRFKVALVIMRVHKILKKKMYNFYNSNFHVLIEIHSQEEIIFKQQICNILQFTGKVMMSYSSNWFMLLLLCTSTPLVLGCDRFDHGSKQVKRKLVDLVMEDYDILLC